ncbi:MAG: hypothetical protein JWN82_701 [Candidatus Saccharibacteria bacterium]|nr:hypothetical protein [Candidatus Saccharibacteria bacterium]
MAIEVDQLRQQLGLREHDLVLSESDQSGFARNAEYNGLMAGLECFMGRIVQERTMSFYEVSGFHTEDESTIRALIAPYDHFREIDESTGMFSYVRMLVTQDFKKQEERPLLCNDFVIDTVRRQMGWRQQTVQLSPNKGGQLVWQCSKDDVPKLLQGNNSEERHLGQTSITVHMGTAYELDPPISDTDQKVIAAKKFLEHMKHIFRNGSELPINALSFVRHDKLLG